MFILHVVSGKNPRWPPIIQQYNNHFSKCRRKLFLALKKFSDTKKLHSIINSIYFTYSYREYKKCDYLKTTH